MTGTADNIVAVMATPKAGVSNPIRKGPVWVQVFIPIEQEPHLIPSVYNQMSWTFIRLRCGLYLVGIKTWTHTGPVWIRL